MRKSFAYGVFWIGAVAFAAALSCNPARHAINQKQLIDEAIAKWVLENPVPMSEMMIPGDTVILRDTAWVDSYVFDTVYLKDTVRITKTAYKTIREIVNVRDTVVRTVNNTEAIIKLQEEKNLIQGRLFASEASQDRQRWWLILLSFVCSLLIYISIKRR